MFKALGDATRLGIFQMLRCCSGVGRGIEVDNETGDCRPAGSLSVGEVCCRIGGSMSTISHHLKELRLAGLIRMAGEDVGTARCVAPPSRPLRISGEQARMQANLCIRCHGRPLIC